MKSIVTPSEVISEIMTRFQKCIGVKKMIYFWSAFSSLLLSLAITDAYSETISKERVEDRKAYREITSSSSDFSKQCVLQAKNCIAVVLLIGQDKSSLVNKKRELIIKLLAERESIDPNEIKFDSLTASTKRQIMFEAYKVSYPEIFKGLTSAFEEQGIRIKIFPGRISVVRNSAVMFMIDGIPYEDENGRAAFTISDRSVFDEVESTKISLQTALTMQSLKVRE